MALLRLDGPVRALRPRACLWADHAVRRPRSHITNNNHPNRPLLLVSSRQHAAACQSAARDSLRRWASTYSQPAATQLMPPPPAGLEAYNEGPYGEAVEMLRDREYPHMNQGIYLDHSGTTIYARSTVEAFADKMTKNLYGNPHSANEPAKASGDMVDEIRDRALRFLGADPAHFDLVFVANATAAIKLVADAFRDLAERTWSGSFWYGYHKDSHTSLVGVRELAGGAGVASGNSAGHARCFGSDMEVEAWLAGDDMGRGAMENSIRGRRRAAGGLGLFAYPGQSNMSGRRLPLSWAGRLRHGGPGGGSGGRGLHANTYSLLDAAALAMTKPMAGVFADPDAAPDFTALSFYKIFGFPDLGGLVVRRDSGHILTLRKYFGGGTVTMVGAVGKAWHMSKGHEASAAAAAQPPGAAAEYSIHDGLEDGTLPFHSILALGEAMGVHERLYGSMDNVSRHTSRLAARLFRGVAGLRHHDGAPVCHIYGDEEGTRPAFGDADRQGATMAFNVVNPDGTYVPYSEVEEVANSKGIYIRSGGICCPGGLFTALDYEPWELERAMSAGHHCGPHGLSMVNQLPTGVVRASLGPMSTARDIDVFVQFLGETFAARQQETPEQQQQQQHIDSGRDRPLEALACFG
ncbi:molybdenum cofactor sulfurase [Gaeumannomyces tritici R3-111a-1]|uniref:Molybdenum cofactor sulfurase n=1 Tax=Gaeumannomyces tritici (strain R3-111a-1) TaxID=644352 RepID=J3P7W1_GAET3|nr:molybdenum cofactor sulfurase [Gaeumannomyces tritici R3-111a-1]EJT72744.1 molybdenum cofactor sulfurase [Gaeumannomyces tritici R3-111a-1]